MHRANAFIPPGAAALGVGLYTFFHPGLRKGNAEPDPADEDGGVPPDPAASQQPAEVLRFP
jgi:hypothetical protein